MFVVLVYHCRQFLEKYGAIHNLNCQPVEITSSPRHLTMDHKRVAEATVTMYTLQVNYLIRLVTRMLEPLPSPNVLVWH